MSETSHVEVVAKLKEANLGPLIVDVDHVGICVASMDDGAELWSALLGSPLVDREDVSAANATAGFFRFASGSAIELVTPFGQNKGLDKFLESRGQALHHLAIRVTDIEEAVNRLLTAGVAMIDKTPRVGAAGHLVAFLHPKVLNGTLLELVQHRE